MTRALATSSLLLLFAAGCYSYSPVPVESVAPGVSVRTRVSATQAERAEEVLGRNSRVLAGSVVENTGETLLLSVTSAAAFAGSDTGPLHQRLTIPRSEIVEVEARRLDPWRTAGVVAVGVGVVGFVATQALDDDPSAPGGGKGGGEQWIGFRLPVRF